MPLGLSIGVSKGYKPGAEAESGLPHRQPSSGEQRWEDETLKPALRETPERQEEFTTLSGVPIQRLYTPADLAKFDYSQHLGDPGEYPYTRGIHPTMYRGRIWTMRQYSGFGSAEATNERFKYLISQGQTGLSVAFDLPTQLGYDSDSTRAEGEVGRVGVPISTIARRSDCSGGKM